MKKYFFALILITLSVFANAQIQLSDSAKISLMTTSPWSGAVYAVYGHTAIFVKDDFTGINAVFNYGYFDKSKPNFLYHYIRGETDYILGVVPLDAFLQEYREKGVEVVEQEQPEVAEKPAAKASFLSPLVRKMLDEHQLDPDQIQGTGAGGRITKQDVEAYLASPKKESPSVPESKTEVKEKPVQPAKAAPAITTCA